MRKNSILRPIIWIFLTLAPRFVKYRLQMVAIRGRFWYHLGIWKDCLCSQAFYPPEAEADKYGKCQVNIYLLFSSLG
jgi:hypothetical protein